MKALDETLKGSNVELKDKYSKNLSAILREDWADRASKFTNKYQVKALKILVGNNKNKVTEAILKKSLSFTNSAQSEAFEFLFKNVKQKHGLFEKALKFNNNVQSNALIVLGNYYIEQNHIKERPSIGLIDAGRCITKALRFTSKAQVDVLDILLARNAGSRTIDDIITDALSINDVVGDSEFTDDQLEVIEFLIENSDERSLTDSITIALKFTNENQIPIFYLLVNNNGDIVTDKIIENALMITTVDYQYEALVALIENNNDSKTIAGIFTDLIEFKNDAQVSALYVLLKNNGGMVTKTIIENALKFTEEAKVAELRASIESAKKESGVSASTSLEDPLAGVDRRIMAEDGTTSIAPGTGIGLRNITTSASSSAAAGAGAGAGTSTRGMKRDRSDEDSGRVQEARRKLELEGSFVRDELRRKATRAAPEGHRGL